MELLVIENCSYKRFEDIRDDMWSTDPENNQNPTGAGLISADYSKGMRMARFVFKSVENIPEHLTQYMQGEIR